jgi:Peptidase family M23
MVFRSGNALSAVTFAALVLAPGASAWAWPVDGPVLRPFVAAGDPYAGGQHRGIDIGAPSGSDVRSATTGVVAFAGQLPRQGLCLTIRTEDGYSVTLVHLGSIGVSVGTQVSQGDVVGTIGPSGEPEGTEPYVYLGIRLTADPNGYVDPLTLLPARHAPEPLPAPQQQAQSQVPAPTAQPQNAAPPRSAGNVSPHPTAVDGHARQSAVAKPKPLRAQARMSSGPSRSARRGIEETERTVRTEASARPIRVRATHPRPPAPSPTRPRAPVDPRGKPRTVRQPVATAVKVPPVAARRPRRPRRVLLVPLGLFGLALLAGGIATRRRPALTAPRRFAQPPLRKMSTIEAPLEERLPEPPTAANSDRRRLALREWPTASGACRRLRRAVGHHCALSPAPGRPRPHGQRHGRARNARHGRGRSRRTIAA